MANKRGIKSLTNFALDNGWDVDRTGRGHLRFKGPEGQLVFSAGTPSDYRTLYNTAAKLRRAGLDVPHSGGWKA